MDNPAAQQILSLYQRHTEAFARLRSCSLFEKAWLDKFIRIAGKPGHILDIGCGTGQPIAAYFIDQGLQVTGVDGTPAMLEHARAHLPDQRWIQQDMRQLALDETFEGLIAWDSFFHLTQDDQRSMFGIFARHSKVGSALMFTSGPADGIAMGQFEGEPLFHASLAPQEYRALLATHGFAVLEMKPEDPECAGHTIWLAEKIYDK
ncbi:class I SAM-dependent DNA methyltransferase [Kluyvera intermedia]|jgi:SAM-dependent methyltransferase|uniref:class I SAM-dependent DNA methyltransferase n=1 Tax=Kluyvera intermedia TaxID=61648 RepID=UPI00242E0D4E|nr:class I SAM-dependent methyltransferase [Kluyvera intermedia]WEJ86019.1 MAG: class I SAM-dependent methyltransferase [Kluyvera intermedia]